jgi:hypothetical protein
LIVDTSPVIALVFLKDEATEFARMLADHSAFVVGTRGLFDILRRNGMCLTLTVLTLRRPVDISPLEVGKSASWNGSNAGGREGDSPGDFAAHCHESGCHRLLGLAAP